MHRQLTESDLVASIVQLRRAIVTTRARGARSGLRDVEVRLRTALGPSITKTQAALALGISVTALDRWVERGYLAVVEKPGSSRHELEARSFLELAEQVSAVSAEAGDARTPVARAIGQLGWKPQAAGRRVLRRDVATLPRPNIAERELVAMLCSTTPEERVREVAELSRLLAPAAGHER